MSQANILGFNDSQLPVGVVMPYAGKLIPYNWLLCDGGLFYRADFPELFKVIGTIYGTTAPNDFQMPDLMGKIPLGADYNSDLSTAGVISNGTVDVTMYPDNLPDAMPFTWNVGSIVANMGGANLFPVQSNQISSSNSLAAKDGVSISGSVPMPSCQLTLDFSYGGGGDNPHQYPLTTAGATGVLGGYQMKYIIKGTYSAKQ